MSSDRRHPPARSGSDGVSRSATAPERAQEHPRDYTLDWSQLMAKSQGGDAASYRTLLEAIAPYLRALAARRHRDQRDIEDAVQDILLTVHQIRHTYDPARPFGPWLVAIANRRLVDRLRRQGRSTARETSLEPHHETFAAPEANLQTDPMEQGALRAAVAGLPPRQREAITLLKLQELSLKEASAASGLTVASLKVSVHRGMKNLKKLLSDRSNEN
jgi:RNA polymerase sigma factor (sigma-70 family)